MKVQEQGEGRWAAAGGEPHIALQPALGHCQGVPDHGQRVPGHCWRVPGHSHPDVSVAIPTNLCAHISIETNFAFRSWQGPLAVMG